MQSAICWIRRDLRLSDHHALCQAFNDFEQVYIIFIFDPHILNQLPNKEDSRVHFIIDSLIELDSELKKQQQKLHLFYGKPEEIIPRLAQDLKAQALYFNRDYAPYPKMRDHKVAKLMHQMNVQVKSFQDHVLFETPTTLKDDGTTYQVFTPYKRKWLGNLLEQNNLWPSYKVKIKALTSGQKINSLSLNDSELFKQIGFQPAPPIFPGGEQSALQQLKQFSKRIDHYHELRDFPAAHATSMLSACIRHGTISIRQMATLATSQKSKGHESWLNELIWRDFYHMILDAHPRVAKESFKPAYDKIKWPGSEKLFKAWCQGETGVPIVDAAQRCLNATGTMPNRLRMVSAQYLCKIMLVDWRLGEKYFAHKLLDFDLAANNGGWQWCSSSGCDAAEYFRIFNPYLQSQKFDPKGEFILQWCPELSSLSAKEIHRPEEGQYIKTLVHYEEQRIKAIELYKKALAKN